MAAICVRMYVHIVLSALSIGVALATLDTIRVYGIIYNIINRSLCLCLCKRLICVAQSAKYLYFNNQEMICL